MTKKIRLVVFFLLLGCAAFSQEQRLADHNSIAWFAYTGNFKIAPRMAIYTEYQFRREGHLKNWQQSLLRTGLNYTVSKDVNIIAGYANAHTFTYGDYPTAFAFPEHRFYEMFLVKNPLGKIDLLHRFMIEQRFVGRVTEVNGIKNTDFSYLNRVRYRFRGEIPLSRKSPGNKWSFIVQDEIFIGFGKNLGANVFDQNRVGLMLGYKLNKAVKLEAGYLNQTLQQGRRINNSPVYQYNNGFAIAANFNIDLTR